MGRGPIEGIVLAAGSCRRMGAPKQVIAVGGKPMLIRVLETALETDLDRIVSVTGSNAELVHETIKPLLHESRVEVAVNRDFRERIASSIITGIRSLTPEAQSAMFILGDQPLLDKKTLNNLIHSFLGSSREICVPIAGGKAGTPVIFGRCFFLRDSWS